MPREKQAALMDDGRVHDMHGGEIIVAAPSARHLVW